MEIKKEAKLKGELAELERQHKEEKKRLGKSEEYTRIQERHKEIDKEEGKLSNEEDRLNKKMADKFLDDDSNFPSPSYSRGDSWGPRVRTNIRDEVLDAIKKVSGGLSKLRASDIEDAVRALVRKERSKNERLGLIRREMDALRDEESALWKRERELEDVQRELSVRIYDVKKKLDEIEFARENPEKARSQTEKEKARAEVTKKIDEIYKEIG